MSSRVRRILHLIRCGRFDSLCYAVRTRLLGLDLSPVSNEALGFARDRAHSHANSGGPDLSRVLRALAIPRGSRIVDLGCGKGGAVFTFSRFPFSEIMGVDISERMIHIASANGARLGLHSIKFLCMDAGKFTDLDRFTHIYMFNPFPRVVVEEVIENIADSLSRSPRAITLLYKQSNRPDRIIDSLFTLQREFRSPYSHTFYLYFHGKDMPLPTRQYRVAIA